MTANAGEDVGKENPLFSDCGVSTGPSVMEKHIEGPWDRDKTTNHMAHMDKEQITKMLALNYLK